MMPSKKGSCTSCDGRGSIAYEDGMSEAKCLDCNGTGRAFMHRHHFVAGKDGCQHPDCPIHAKKEPIPKGRCICEEKGYHPGVYHFYRDCPVHWHYSSEGKKPQGKDSDTSDILPSERIEEIAKRHARHSERKTPNKTDWLDAILDYLDERLG